MDMAISVGIQSLVRQTYQASKKENVLLGGQLYMVGPSPGANIQDDANQLRSLTTMIMNGQEEGDYHRIDHSGP
jgi:hypothetical protein